MGLHSPRGLVLPVALLRESLWRAAVRDLDVAFDDGTLGHGGNGVFFAECHVRYIVECLRAIFERDAAAMAVTPDALESYLEKLIEDLPTFVQSIETVDNWYRGGRDRVYTNEHVRVRSAPCVK